jgi:alanine racemase
MAESAGIDSFAVFDAGEAEQALNIKQPKTDIMIMGMIDNDELEWAIENEISFFVFDSDRLEYAVLAAQKTGQRARIHVEIETGMNRTGFTINNLDKVIEGLRAHQQSLILEGVCTHYAGAESISNHARIMQQIEIFNKARNKFDTEGLRPKYYHSACSAAALTYKNTIMDMVRFGIAQFGFWPSQETRMFNMLSKEDGFIKDPLNQILRWKSRIMSIKKVPKGEFVGYGTTALMTEKSIIATVPVGYAYGFSRNLSNIGHVLVKGRKAGVIGMVNMNVILINITGIPEVKKNDEVVLIGKQGRKRITVSSFCNITDNVNYELLTRLPESIPRQVIEK